MINPSTINLSALPFVALQNRFNLPPVAGIYFAIDGQEVVQYVGRTKNLKTRWVSHHREKDLIDRSSVSIAYLVVSDCALLPEIERALIDWFDPSLNNRRGDRICGKTPFWQLRERTGMTVTQVASQIGVTEGAVRSWEVGRHVPRLPITQIPALLNAYGCTLEEVIQAAQETQKKVNADD